MYEIDKDIKKLMEQREVDYAEAQQMYENGERPKGPDELNLADLRESDEESASEVSMSSGLPSDVTLSESDDEEAAKEAREKKEDETEEEHKARLETRFRSHAYFPRKFSNLARGSLTYLKSCSVYT